MQHFVDFFSELVYRLFEDTPAFFKVIQKVALVTAAISSVVIYLNSVDRKIPEWLCFMDNVSVLVTATVAAVLAKLPNSGGSE